MGTDRQIFYKPISMAVVASGAALGYGNFMEVPHLVASQGGSAFLLLFFICQLVVAVPVMLSELLLGRNSRKDMLTGWNSIQVGRDVSKGWWRVGWVMLSAAILALAIYSVIFSWAAAYFERSWVVGFTENTLFNRQLIETIRDFDRLIGNQVLFVVVLGVFALISSFRGITRIMMVLVPMTLLSYLLLVIQALNFDNFLTVMVQVFEWRDHQITASTFNLSLEHAFFSLGIGMGALWFCGSYTDHSVSVGRAALLVLLFDFLATLMIALFYAGLGVFDSDQKSAVELLFVNVPALLPPSGIWLLFGSLLLTGVTSALLVFEAVVLVAMKVLRCEKWQAVIITMVVSFSLGAVAQASFNQLDNLSWYGRTIYEAIVMLSSGVLVPLAGALIAVFVGWRMKTDSLKQEWQPSLIWRFIAWLYALRFISIVAIILVFFAAIRQHLGFDIFQTIVLMISVGFIIYSTNKLEQHSDTLRW